MMRDADATTWGPALPSVVEVSWSESEAVCVLRPQHCWHVQLVTGVGPTHIVKGTRCCCRCGVRQVAHPEKDVEHGPLRPPSLSLLDLMIESSRG